MLNHSVTPSASASTPPFWAQSGYRCRLEWGRRGARAAAERGDVLVVVDVLSFSTAAVTAVAHGAVIYPCAWDDDHAATTVGHGVELAVKRDEVPARGRFSLSPGTFAGVAAGTRVVLPSPNGATCSRYGRAVPHLFVGALVNARAVAGAVAAVLASTELCVTVLACGERWRQPDEDGALRFAVEDYVGAGAILSCLPRDLSRSPEAGLAEIAFRSAEGQLAQMLSECASGRELRQIGFADDVERAARLNAFDVVPVMRGEWLVANA